MGIKAIGTPKPINQAIAGNCKIKIPAKESAIRKKMRTKEEKRVEEVTFLVPPRGKLAKTFLAIAKKFNIERKLARENARGNLVKAKSNKESKSITILNSTRALNVMRILSIRKPYRHKYVSMP